MLQASHMQSESDLGRSPLLRSLERTLYFQVSALPANNLVHQCLLYCTLEGMETICALTKEFNGLESECVLSTGFALRLRSCTKCWKTGGWFTPNLAIGISVKLHPSPQQRATSFSLLWERSIGAALCFCRPGILSAAVFLFLDGFEDLGLKNKKQNQTNVSPSSLSLASHSGQEAVEKNNTLTVKHRTRAWTKTSQWDKSIVVRQWKIHWTATAF